MPKLTDEKLVSIVNSEFSQAMGSPAGEIAHERAKAWRYYLSEKRGDEVEGQSEVVSSDVSDVVDGIMPSLLRIFTTADNLVAFDAVGAEDEAAAAQESDYVNHIFFKKNPAFIILFFWFFDALLQKNGIVKAWWDEAEEVTTESYRGLSEPEMLELMGDDELEPVERSERTAETVDETGQPVMATVHDVTFKRVTKDGRARVDNVPPEEFRISSDSRSIDPSGARMVGHEREITRSELLDMGFDKKLVESLPAEGDVISSPEEQARKDKTDDQFEGTDDRSQDMILVREAYIKVDYDGDGRSELRQVFTASEKLLSNEEVDRQPFHVICGSPLPHKFFGRAYAMKAEDIQDVNTTLTRQTLNNLYHSNNPSHAVWEHAIGENTLDDLLTTRVGSVKRFARPVNESWAPMTVPFTAQSSFAMLEYFDRVKRDRTGIRSDAEGLSPDALKNIQQSVLMQATDLSKMKVEAVARIFAETGVKSLFLHLHELLQKHQKKSDVVKLRGEWVPISPQEWRTRRDMTVQIGLGIGTREQNLLHLEAIAGKQKEIIEAGGMNLLVTPQNIFQTMSEFVRNANLKSPELYFTDPGNQPAPPPSSEQQQMQEQAMQLEQKRQQLDEQKRQQDQQKIQLQAQEQQMKHQREMLELERKTEADKDRFTVENEKLRNALTEMELKYKTDVPGAAI